jgi:SAM-dependent methyltransferase
MPGGGAVKANNPYETDRSLAEYLLFHYGTREEILPYPFGPIAALGFPVRCVSTCLDRTALPAAARALDLGCAVGRSSFELARSCADVLGIDRSRRFIGAAAALAAGGCIEYARVEEGHLTTPLVARVPDGIERSRVRFAVGDAMRLPKDIGRFDVLLLANLIDRLADPRRCLGRLADPAVPGVQVLNT